MSISNIRREYILKSLSEDDVQEDPFRQFDVWWNEAIRSAIVEPNAMTLATASVDGLPSARVVLLKGFSEEGFIFYTNYNSYKAKHLEENPRACIVFFWKELERQVRITGLVGKVNASTSDEYFNSRPAGSQAGAWISPQSEVIESREWLDRREREILEQFRGKPITRPPYWGGYILRAVTIEFWQGRPNRLHDRIQYTLMENGKWKIERLAP